MLVTYIRSSSYNNYDYCQQQYYINYVLGYPSISGKKAQMGTIVHKVMECLAACQKKTQDKPDSNLMSITDDALGKVTFTKSKLSSDKFVNDIVDKSLEHYISNCIHTYTEKDKENCRKWSWSALQYNDGQFDPRRRNIVATEPQFDIPIEEDWAKYKYKMPDGSTLKGRLAIKGTIDLVTEVDENVIEVIDWKTGRRLDWATGKEKTPAKLQKDIQLRMYHLAAKELYPHVKTFLVTIHFINDGGPFTMHFQDQDIPQTKEMIRKKFETIRDTERPQLNKSWKCTKLCSAGKTTFEGTSIGPIIERRFGVPSRYGEYMTKCEQTKYMIEKHGIDWVTSNMASPDHIIGKYQAPGELP